jgi:hypothetical protein
VPNSFSLAASTTAPSGNNLNNLSAFLFIFLAALLKSPLFKLAFGSVTFLAGTSNISAVVSGDKSFNFLNVKFLGSTFLIPCFIFDTAACLFFY